jgi:hypothetical protein
MRDAVVSGGHDASQRQPNGRQAGSKVPFCAHFANDCTVRHPEGQGLPPVRHQQAGCLLLS